MEGRSAGRRPGRRFLHPEYSANQLSSTVASLACPHVCGERARIARIAAGAPPPLLPPKVTISPAAGNHTPIPCTTPTGKKNSVGDQQGIPVVGGTKHNGSQPCRVEEQPARQQRDRGFQVHCPRACAPHRSPPLGRYSASPIRRPKCISPMPASSTCASYVEALIEHTAICATRHAMLHHDSCLVGSRHRPASGRLGFRSLGEHAGEHGIDRAQVHRRVHRRSRSTSDIRPATSGSARSARNSPLRRAQPLPCRHRIALHDP